MFTGCIVIVNASMAMTSVTLMQAIIKSRLVVARVISIDTAVLLDHGLPAGPNKRICVRKVGVHGRGGYIPR